MPAVLQFPQEDGFVLEVHLAYLDVDQGIRADSGCQERVDGCPCAPFSPMLGCGPLQQPLEFGFRVRLLQVLVLLDEREGELLHVFPVGAKVQEDAQTADSGVDGADAVTLGHFMVHEILHHQRRELIHELDRGDLLEILQVFAVILYRARGEVLQPAVPEEFFHCTRQLLLTDSVYLLDLLHIARFAPFCTARNLVHLPRSKRASPSVPNRPLGQ